MNDKLIMGAMRTEIIDAIMARNYTAEFKVSIPEDLHKFNIKYKGTDMTQYGKLFAVSVICNEILNEWSKEYEVPYKDAVEWFIGTLAEYHKIDKMEDK